MDCIPDALEQQCVVCGWKVKKGRVFPHRNCTNPPNLRQKTHRITSMDCLAGTELKKLLHKMKINLDGNCPCKQRSVVMDREGCDWCETNIETIITWLQQEAKRRKLPFVRAAGKLLVRRAIHNARRNQAKQQ